MTKSTETEKNVKKNLKMQSLSQDIFSLVSNNLAILHSDESENNCEIAGEHITCFLIVYKVKWLNCNMDNVIT